MKKRARVITYLLHSSDAGEGTVGKSVMVLTSDVVVVLKEVCMYKPKSSCCCYSFCNVDILSLVCMYVRMSSYAYMPCFLTLYRHDFVVFLYFFSAQYINGVQPSSNQTKHTLKCWIKMIAFLLSLLQWKSYDILFLNCQTFFRWKSTISLKLKVNDV